MSTIEAVEKRSQNPVYDPVRGMLIDPETGLVIEENIIDTNTEWRAYDVEEKYRKERTGTIATWRHDMGIGSVIGGKMKKRLISMNYYVNLRGSRKRIKMLRMFIDMARKLGLPSTAIDDGTKIIHKVCSSAVLPPNVRESLAKALVYHIILRLCRAYGIPIHPLELRKTMGLTNSIDALRKALRALQFLDAFNKVKDAGNLTNIINGASYIVSRLGLPNDVAMLATTIAQTLYNDGYRPAVLDGKRPISIASALVYISSILSGTRVTQEKLNKITRTSSNAIRDSAREIIKNLDIEVLL